MQIIAEFRPCSNCINPFSVDRIDLHEAYCFRNIKRCGQCNAFVDIHEMESHQEQFHQKRPCNHCKAEYIPEELNIHAEQCSRRPKACAYCETDIAAVELGTHENVCGARTRVCGTCNQNVMLKDLAGHEERCRERQAERQAQRQKQRERQRQRERERERQPPVLQNYSRPPQVPAVNIGQRRNENQRDLSGHNRHIQYGGERSLSTNKNNEKNYVSKKPKDTKYHKIIPMEGIHPRVDILPISVQLTISNNGKREREPFRAKNIQV